MNQLFGHRLQELKNLPVSEWGACAILAWLLSSFCTGSFMHSGEIDYVAQGNFWLSVGLFLLLFIFLLFGTAFGGVPFRGAVLVFLVLAACVVVYLRNNDYYSVGLAGMVMIVILCQRKDFWQGIAEGKEAPFHRVLAYMIIFCVLVGFISAVTVCRYLTFGAPVFDMGVFAQSFESLRVTGIPWNTCERNTLISHFQVHPSLIFYVALPFYALFPNPGTLQVIQALFAASSLIPLYFLCRRRKMASLAMVAMGLALAAYPALSGGTFYDFHENCFLTACLLWLILAVECDSWVGMVLASLFVFSIKEDAAIYSAFLALYFIFSGKRKKKGLILFLLSCFAFGVTNAYLGGSEFGVADLRYSNLVVDPNGSMFQIIATAWYHPFYLLKECLDMEKVWYLILMLLPFSTVLFRRKSWTCFLLFGPMILLNLMPGYAYMHTINYQYNFGNVALLFYFFLVCTDEFDREKVTRFAVACAVCCLVMTVGLKGRRIEIVKDYSKHAREFRHLESVLNAIPQDASVSASTYFVAHLYDHEELYPVSSGIEAEYLAIDLSRDTGRTEEALLETGHYEAVYQEAGLVAVYRRVDALRE